MTIRAVFWDFGGVIQRTEYQTPRQRLAERFGMDYHDLDKLVFQSGTAAQATLGEIGENEHWQAVAGRLKVNENEVARIKAQFFAGDVIDRELVQFIRALRRRAHVGLISNAWDGMRAHLQREGLLDAFDSLVVSAEVGAAKPDARIYRMALDQAKVKAEEAVFVDDMPENIEACRQIGMKGILFQDSREVIAQLEAVL